MSINFKVQKITSNENIHSRLSSFESKFKKITNIYSIKCQEIKSTFCKKNSNGDECVTIEATVNKIRRIQRHMKKMSSYYCHVIIINAKNKDGQLFSSFVNDLSSKDQIFFFNVNHSHPVTRRKNIPTLVFQIKYQSFLYLFKNDDSDWINKETYSLKWLMEPNFETINGPGKYSLFGEIIKTIVFVDENLMLIQLKSHDKLKFNILKYPQQIPHIWKILKQGSSADKDNENYECGSNQTDILVLKPCSEFLKLENNYRVHLKNVKCKQYTSKNHQPVFFLCMKGVEKNLKVVPIETAAIKSLRPPASKPCFKIPDDLIPANVKTNGYRQNSRSDFTKKELIRRILEDSPPTKPSSYLSSSSSSSSDSSISSSTINELMITDDIALSPLRPNFDGSQNLIELNTNVTDGLEEHSNDCVNLKNCSPILISDDSDTTLTIDDSDRASPDLISVSHFLVEDGSSADIIINSDDDDSNNLTSLPNYTEEMCTENAMNVNNKIIPIITLSDDDQHDTPPPLIGFNSHKSIGPCRLISMYPFVSDGEAADIVSGFCTKCKSFKRFSSLKVFRKNNQVKHCVCPDCKTLLCLTFYFKMTFLYGENENESIEVHCSDYAAEMVLNKIISESITVEKYLSTTSKYNQVIASAFKKIIFDQINIELQVQHSLDDHAVLLISFDF